MEGQLQEDWEVVLQRVTTTTQEDYKSKSLEEIGDEDGTRGMVTFDYFSLENNNGMCRVDAIDEDGSVQSDSPGWIEPRSDAPYGPKHFSELWSDTSSDRLDDQRLAGDDDLGLEISEEYSENIAKEKHLEEDWLGSSGEMELLSSDERIDTEGEEESGKCISIDSSVESGGGGGERGFVWWRIPIEVLKCCVFKVNPIWSFSMAAAVVGFVMLGRRLYNMKKKSRTLQLKVLLDDKVANHAARLNEAISLVKRVPIIRPALPSSVVGMNQWSMMSLR
ncbi:uncharacterized protein LOC18030387 isoform X2 [Eutrema salsugineum]|uniref:uncharacterized protein LOC18030387 isoform X2 n=1 Tax=Eutrema salsugineum TaxID=72664 RepID=UPI000CECFC0E|nr:uncharacterized protein LOC18030387 isoform X2 [Eutrema salsugineum]